MELAALIEGLSDPGAYPYAVFQIEVKQTHISVAFLAGPYVYKIKKPVAPGFLDFSTLEKRRHFCEEEVRLNRRLAPDVYLGAVPVTREGVRVRFEGAGEVVEWAVKMVRLPEEVTVHARLERGGVGVPLAASIARRIAAFHRNARTGAHIASFEIVARNLRDVLTQSKPQVGTTVSSSVYERLTQLTECALQRNQALIEARAASGRTRDGHGDLHLDHVYYFPDRRPPGDLVIIDCIEFNERFRYIDPVADIAFAAMDFTYHGRRDLAQAFADAYFVAAGDAEGRALLPLYTAYRASVRGSVDGMKLAEPEVPPAERQRALTSARAHWLLALSQLEEASEQPCLLLVAGLPGTGKSTLARALAERANFEVIRSDAMRKELAGLRSDERAGEAIYSPEWNDRTYAGCLERAEQMLFEGRRVLIDATFRQERHRRTFVDAAQTWCVPAGFLICSAKPHLVQKRLEQRRHDVSDADWSVFLTTAMAWEEPAASTREVICNIDTTDSWELVLTRALEMLVELGMRGRESSTR
jgi:aminoglycoside phosphotransferase family enzyme/predicted kinase